MMLLIYQYLGFLLIPIIKLNILFRLLNNKEDQKRYFERYGLSFLERPEGKLIWIHASSIGEFKSSITIINKLSSHFTILLTTTTLTASNYAKNHFGNKIIHQYAPLDVKTWVNRFLKKWKPSFVLWVESDLWPITLSLLKERSIKSFLINSRISPKSFNKWKYFKKFFTNMTNVFDEIYAQSKIDKGKLESLTNRKINFIGNLKLTSKEKLNDELEFNNLQKKLNHHKIIMFASTHKGEEELFINFIKNIIKTNRNLKIIIAPRHIDRSTSILENFKKENIRSIFFEDSLNLEEDLFIVKSFGKMALFYSLSDIVILGGSFVNLGGHNPMEPAQNNCVVITGPHIYNWQDIFLDMKNNKACIICEEIIELENIVNNLFQDFDQINSLKKLSKKFADNNFFEIENLTNKIHSYLKEIKC